MCSGLKVEGGFPWKLWEDLAWLWPCSEMGEEGSVGGGEQAVTAHQWMAVVSRWAFDWFFQASGSGSGFG